MTEEGEGRSGGRPFPKFAAREMSQPSPAFDHQISYHATAAAQGLVANWRSGWSGRRTFQEPRQKALEPRCCASSPSGSTRRTGLRRFGFGRRAVLQRPGGGSRWMSGPCSRAISSSPDTSGPITLSRTKKNGWRSAKTRGRHPMPLLTGEAGTVGKQSLLQLRSGCAWGIVRLRGPAANRLRNNARVNPRAAWAIIRLRRCRGRRSGDRHNRNLAPRPRPRSPPYRPRLIATTSCKVKKIILGHGQSRPRRRCRHQWRRRYAARRITSRMNLGLCRPRPADGLAALAKNGSQCCEHGECQHHPNCCQRRIAAALDPLHADFSPKID